MVTNMKDRTFLSKDLKMIFVSIISVAMLVVACFLLTGTIRAQAASTEASYKYYTSICIRKGDTLWSIANTYMSDEYHDIHEYIQEVRELNHIEDSEIHYGQYITVPYYSGDYLE